MRSCKKINPLHVSLFVCSILGLKVFVQRYDIKELKKQCARYDKVIKYLTSVIKDHTWFSSLKDDPDFFLNKAL